MREFWTADQHFDHYGQEGRGVISYCNRPFDSVEKMNEVMIKKCNERVKSEDLLYIAGDFCFRHKERGFEYWRDKINAHTVFVRGNHDTKNKVKTSIVKMLLHKGGLEINVVHDPIYADPNYPINIVGHVHQLWDKISFKEYYDRLKNNVVEDKRWVKKREGFLNKWNISDHNKSLIINVGVDVRNFYPVSMDEVLGIYKRWLKNV